ncbi:UNVERIFIED_CONTAM: hypothetical protein K2H54_048680 [Gekko kuhli]
MDKDPFNTVRGRNWAKSPLTFLFCKQCFYWHRSKAGGCFARSPHLNAAPLGHVTFCPCKSHDLQHWPFGSTECVRKEEAGEICVPVPFSSYLRPSTLWCFLVTDLKLISETNLLSVAK